MNENKPFRLFVIMLVLLTASVVLPADVYAEGFTQPTYRLYHPGTKDHHYTLDLNEYQVLGGRGWVQEGVAWYSDEATSIPVYRLYHSSTFNHHYTRDYNEYQVLGGCGWVQEGVAWYGSPDNSGQSGGASGGSRCQGGAGDGRDPRCPDDAM